MTVVIRETEKCYGKIAVLLLAVIMLAPLFLVTSVSAEEEISINGTHSITLPEYDGAVMLTMSLQKQVDATSVAKVIVYGEGSGDEEAKFLEIDLAEKLATWYRTFNILYFKHTGKYELWQGNIPTDAWYVLSGTDGLSHKETVGNDGASNDTYGKKIRRVEFVSDSNGIKLKDFDAFEVLRMYDENTPVKKINADFTGQTANIGETIPDLGLEAGMESGRSIKAAFNKGGETVTREDGTKWNKYENYFSQFQIARDPANAADTAMRMFKESGDQRLQYVTDFNGYKNTRGNNIRLRFNIYLPGGNNDNAAATLGLQSLFGRAYNFIYFTKRGDGYRVTDMENKDIFQTVPADTWLEFEADFDVEAQKYIVYCKTLNTDSVATRKCLSNLMNEGDIGAGILGTPGFQTVQISSQSSAAEFYMKNITLDGTSNSTRDINNMYKRSLLQFDSSMMEEALAKITIMNQNNPVNGLALDSVVGSGQYNSASGTYEYMCSVKWRSSDPSVISDTGVVYPSIRETKTVTMTATATDVSGHSMSRDFQVTVPKVMPYRVNGIEVSDDDGIAANYLMGGKTISAVNLTRYESDGNNELAIITALYDGDNLEKATVSNIENSGIAAYSDGKVLLANQPKLPNELKSTHRLKVFVFNNLGNIKPMSAVAEYGVPEAAEHKIYICGDSLVAPYDQSIYAPCFGWGEKLKEHMTLPIVNLAIPGKSARSFIAENNFAALENMQSGDYLIVQFMHNDQKTEVPALAGTVNLTTDETAIDYTKSNSYVRYLQMYVDKAREKNANLIFVTSPNRANSLTNNLGGYPAAMRKFAEEKGALCIDIHTQTLELYNKIPEYYRNYYMLWGANIENGYTREDIVERFGPLGKNYQVDTNTDYTHFNRDGANMLATLIAGGIAASDSSLARYVKPEGLKTIDEIAANPPRKTAY